MTNLINLSALEMREGLLRGDFSSVELTKAHLERIQETNPTFNSFITVTTESALAQATKADEVIRTEKKKVPALTGIPIAVKDMLCTEGVETTCASKILQGFVPPYDCTAVSRLRQAGAVILGKTNLDEFAMGSSNENSCFGPVKNPWDHSRVPGGSSGGSAVAVAIGQAPLALGTDTGGSIRQPASLSGIAGLKPTYGRVSRYGAVAYASSLDQIGPFARTVPDLALISSVISGFDPHDSTSMATPVPDYLADLRENHGLGLRGLRVGVPREYFIKGLDPDVEEATRKSLVTLKELGAEIVEISLPHTQYAIACYYIIAPAEASSNLARYDGVRFGYRSPNATTLAEMYEKTRQEGFGWEVKRRILIGTYVLSKGYYDAYYRKAQQVRTLIAEDFRQAFSRHCDVIATPVSPTTAFKIGEKTGSPLQMYLADIFTVPINLAGLPALSLPCGLDNQGLPVGLQFIGPAFGESTLLRVGAAFSDAAEFDSSKLRRFRTRNFIVGIIVEKNMTEFEPVIGLEVHAQLSTQSKIFTTSSTEAGSAPNSLTDPTTLGLPGSLPVLNRRAVDFAIKLGLATHCSITRESIFARKHYLYPDLPKGYQISQYDKPICQHGYLDVRLSDEVKRIRVTRIHLEEDAGKNIHLESEPTSVVDLNRAGVALLEIVSEPDITRIEEAGAYMRQLRQIVRYLDICDGNMEEGSLRCDANISLRPKGETKLGVKVEIKNLNSFRHVEKALAYEISRQTALLNAGETIRQETRLWDENQGATRSMRAKEYAEDYRYFPDPDLLPLIVEDSWIRSIKEGLPELPSQVIARFQSAYGLDRYLAEVLSEERVVARYFDEAVSVHNNPIGIANWVSTELFGRLNKDGTSMTDCPVSPENLANLVKLIDDAVISGKIAKAVFDEMFSSGGEPLEIVKAKGWQQIADSGALEEVVKRVIEAHPQQATEYRQGKTKMLGFFVGQIMKETQGKANPQMVNEIILRLLA